MKFDIRKAVKLKVRSDHENDSRKLKEDLACLHRYIYATNDLLIYVFSMEEQRWKQRKQNGSRD